MQGFGTVLANNVTVSGFLSPFNSLGALVFSNKLTLASNATTTVQLGTNYQCDGGPRRPDAGRHAQYHRWRRIHRRHLHALHIQQHAGHGNGLTIGTTPNSGYTYTIDTNTSHVVKLDRDGVPATPPVAAFTGSPTVGAMQLAVTFTDNSTGTITNRYWNFGDGATTSTTATNLTHTYTNAGTFDVSLTVFGPLGTNTLTRSGYITATNVPLPSITAGVTASNAPLQIGNMIVVVAGDTNTFSVGATDPNSNPLTYQWLFGDGVTNAWSSSNSVDHVYTPPIASRIRPA